MSPTTGSCLCGAIRFSYQGDPVYTAVCYCDDDRKMADISVYQVPKVNFTLTSGQPKTWTKVSDAGREITNHFCDICGTVLYRTGGSPNVKDLIGIRAGVLDDQNIVNTTIPAVEVYVEKRPQWRESIPGAIQLNAKYEVIGDRTAAEKIISETGAKEGL